MKNKEDHEENNAEVTEYDKSNEIVRNLKTIVKLS